MKFLQDTSIGIKVLIPPAILVLAFIVVSSMAVYGLNVQRATLKAANDIALEKITQIDEFITLSERVQSDVFQISVLYFMELPEEEVQPLQKRLEQELSDLNVIYGQILTKWSLDETEMALLEQMEGPMADFTEQAQQAVTVISDNPAFGVLLVRSSTVPFGEFRDTLAAFRNYQEEKIARVEALSDARARTVSAIIAILTLLITLVGILTIVLISSRLISRPIRSMTDLMRRLAQGELSVEVSGLERGDEIGEMARAVEIFRKDGIEKTRAQEALRESEERYRSVVENTPVGILIADDAYQFTYVNDELCQILGYPYEEIIGQDFRKFLDERAKDLVADRYVRRQRGENVPQRYEIVVVRKNGEKRQAEISSAVIVDSAGQVRTVAQVLDISERKRIEKALKESETRYRTLFDQALDAIIVEDRDGKIVSANRAASRFFGYTHQELLSMKTSDLEPPEIRMKPKRAIYSTPNQVGENLETTVIDREGITKPAWITVTPFKVGEQQLFLSIIRDLSERKQREEAEKRRTQELTLLNQIGRELTATLDLQKMTGQLLRATTDIINAEGASIWLWQQGSEDILICQAVYQRGREQTPHNLQVQPGQGIVGWVAQNGESLVVDDVARDHRFFSGIDVQIGFQTRSIIAVPLQLKRRILGVLEVVNKMDGDFDEENLTFLETLAASAAIAAENARLVEALQHRTQELEARNSELDAFSHTVAHDLKNPLARVVGFAEVLAADRAGLPEEALNQRLISIAKNGRRMSAIIDELLLLASVRKVEDIQKTPLDMASIVTEAQILLTPMIEEYQAEITLSETWPTALGHGPWVEEVWRNYISNAIKYGARPPHIELGATEKSDGTVRFWVHDDGPGVPAEAQGRLFTPFTRLDQVRAQGYGLGLSIVRRIVEKLGGEVGMESQVDNGSTFWFSLPAGVDDTNAERDGLDAGHAGVIISQA